MKINFLILLFLIFNAAVCWSQNRIEILTNGNVRSITKEAIHVKNDIIKLRIYADATVNKKTLVDSLKVLGCYYSQSSRESEQSQEQRQRSKKSSSSFKQQKITIYVKPKIESNYVSFKFSVAEIHSCQNEYCKNCQ